MWKRILKMVRVREEQIHEKKFRFLSKALSLLPEVKETLVPPKEGQFFSKPLGKGDSVTIDFGKHW